MGKNDFEISLSNCRNVKSIKDGPLLIKKNILNVFFGGNGIGKSTVGLAIRHIYEKTDETLKPLESYVFMDSADPTLPPDASCLTRIKGLRVFDDEWVSSHCFVKGTLQSDAYELYVRDADVRKLEKGRRDKLGLLNRALESDEVEVLRKSLAAVQKGLGVLKANGEFKGDCGRKVGPMKVRTGAHANQGWHGDFRSLTYTYLGRQPLGPRCDLRWRRKGDGQRWLYQDDEPERLD